MGRFSAACASFLFWPLLLNADNPDIAHTDLETAGSVLRIRSTIEARASIGTCFSVLADFDRLAEFVPGMKSSRVVSSPGKPIMLRQVGVAALAFANYSFDVTLAVTVDPPQQILFHRIDGNLKQMQGSWRIDGDNVHCKIEYQARIEPAFWVPPIVGPMLIRRQVDQQIKGVLAEINRRAQ